MFVNGIFAMDWLGNAIAPWAKLRNKEFDWLIRHKWGYGQCIFIVFDDDLYIAF